MNEALNQQIELTFETVHRISAKQTYRIRCPAHGSGEGMLDE